VIREKTLGSEHPFVATSLTDLGNLSYARGRYAEAEPMFRRALAIEEKTYGSEHPRVGCSLACLAYTYQGMGDLARAEVHYRRALAIREKCLPAVPADVAGILQNYAVLLRSTGRSAEAAAMEARERSLRNPAK
jgi:tetratricopeptide (TPR) repeat protein